MDAYHKKEKSTDEAKFLLMLIKTLKYQSYYFYFHISTLNTVSPLFTKLDSLSEMRLSERRVTVGL